MFDYKLVPLSQGFVAKVSARDYARISRFKWCVCFEGSSRKPYAVRFVSIPHDGPRVKGVWRKRKRRKIKMHREVLQLPPYSEKDLVAHHSDGDGLNNTRENLRALTYSENARIKIKKEVQPWL